MHRVQSTLRQDEELSKIVKITPLGVAHPPRQFIGLTAFMSASGLSTSRHSHLHSNHLDLGMSLPSFDPLLLTDD